MAVTWQLDKPVLSFPYSAAVSDKRAHRIFEEDVNQRFLHSGPRLELAESVTIDTIPGCLAVSRITGDGNGEL
jgi:hypothetical protein